MVAHGQCGERQITDTNVTIIRAHSKAVRVINEYQESLAMRICALLITVIESGDNGPYSYFLLHISPVLLLQRVLDICCKLAALLNVTCFIHCYCTHHHSSLFLSYESILYCIAHSSL